MFILNLQDRDGKELKEGDIVAISNGREFSFYCEVKFLEKEQAIAPFHTFSFHSFKKVDRVPEGAIKSSEERCNIWYVPNAEEDNESKSFERYLISWRECEIALEKRAFIIKKFK